MFAVKILVKGRKLMHHNALTEDKKSFLIKIIFFIVLLSLVALMYLESGMLKDALYFIVVFILFIKFLIIKLYY